MLPSARLVRTTTVTDSEGVGRVLVFSAGVNNTLRGGRPSAAAITTVGSCDAQTHSPHIVSWCDSRPRTCLVSYSALLNRDFSKCDGNFFPIG